MNNIFISTLFLLLALLSNSFKGLAQEIFSIETNKHAVVFKADKGKDLHIIYFGSRLNQKQPYASVGSIPPGSLDYSGLMNSAYTPAGSRNLLEPAIEVVHADGNLSLDLRYVSHQTQKPDRNSTLLSIKLKDPVYAFEVTLNYKAYANEDVVEQWAVIKNKEKGTVVLKKYASANLYISADSYWLRQYHGDWAKEMQPEEAKLTYGIKVLDSKLGTRANIFQPPLFMLSANKPATEDEGEVILGTLAWSGNFRFDFEVDPLNNLRVITGINPYASEYQLKPGGEFNTPPFLYAFSSNGKGTASRNLHRWARNNRIWGGYEPRMTLLNNWEATYFNFNQDTLTTLIKDTKRLGVDLFLLDDGWFGNTHARNGDKAGLGDWQVNKQKLPQGIGYLVKEADKNGVKFGIWIEPEMINPSSDLYKTHPEWVIKQPNRPEYMQRNQLVLDLSNPKVQDFVFGVVDTLLSKNPGLAYIKWDCNAVMYNPYSTSLKNPSHLYVDYVNGLYKVLDRVRSKYKKVEMMLCSGGGGRSDYGLLKYFNEFWPSDNTDPLERIFIQYEYSYFFPPITHCNHVTDMGKQPIKFRTDVAMMGKLGFDIVVSKLSENDLKFCQQAVKNYDLISTVIRQGDFYRLASPRENDFASVAFVDPEKDSAVMFTYLTGNRYGSGTSVPIKFAGLDEKKRYRVQEINLYPGQQSTLKPDEYSGHYLMTVGINPIVNATRSSVVLKVDQMK